MEQCNLPTKVVPPNLLGFTSFQTATLAGAGQVMAAHSVIWFLGLEPLTFRLPSTASLTTEHPQPHWAI